MKINSVILPCEVKARELNSKLLLGCILAERGFEVVVGSRNVIHSRLSEFDRSVYLGKDVRHSSVEILKILQALGHVFVAQDEEAQFYYSREKYLRARVHPKVFQSAADLIAWGPDNAEAWKNSPSYRGNPIYIVGNGRVDLLRPELRTIYAREAQSHQKTFGSYILVSSNFSSLNHFIAGLTTVQPSAARSLDMTSDWSTNLAAHRTMIFRAFLDLVPQLADAFPAMHIIVRPHPAESHSAWMSAAIGRKNVTVTNTGDILPWLLGAHALIHNGCTTGMEAYLMDRHAVAFQPVKSHAHDLHLPNQLSFSAADIHQMIGHLASEFSRQTGPASMRTVGRDAILAQHVTTNSNKLASEFIADVVQLRAFNAVKDVSAASKLYGRSRAFIRTTLKAWNSRNAQHKSSASYTLHRFPSTSKLEIESRVGLMSAALSRFQNIVVTDLGDSVFRLANRKL